MDKNTVGVVVARFQTTELHAGHRFLLDEVSERHPKMLVVLGSPQTWVATAKNPLDFATRRELVRKAYPSALIAEARDNRSNAIWSAKLDRIIRETCPGHEPVLYGSRDSFLSYYTGKARRVELPPVEGACATDVRTDVTMHPSHTADFRAGAIYAAAMRPPKLHDFGFRGSTSKESASIGAGAHLVSFQGTDTLPGIMFARRYYHEQMAGFSIPAAEHSTITSWGREHEADAFRNMLEKFPTGLVAVVSDSYDIFHACEQLWGRELRDLVLQREGTLIVRPDSGYPPEIVVRVLEILGRVFGFTVNAKGFRVLNPHVRVIQGDGIDYAMLGLVLEAMETAGWSADNIAFGSGGGLLQKLDRDMQKCAIKCSAIDRDGVWHDVHKDPITDPGKRSKAGRLMRVNDGSYHTVRVGESDLPNLLEPVFRNGEVLRDQTFADIRRRALL
jgi:nicotinic acid phosphoribosyltransferase